MSCHINRRIGGILRNTMNTSKNRTSPVLDLQERRQAAGWTRIDLALASGTSPATVYSAERGLHACEKTPPSRPRPRRGARARRTPQ